MHRVIVALLLLLVGLAPLLGQTPTGPQKKKSAEKGKLVVPTVELYGSVRDPNWGAMSGYGYEHYDYAYSYSADYVSEESEGKEKSGQGEKRTTGEAR